MQILADIPFLVGVSAFFGAVYPQKLLVTDFGIPGSKGQKFDASLLAGEFLTLGPAKNMSK